MTEEELINKIIETSGTLNHRDDREIRQTLIALNQLGFALIKKLQSIC